MPHGIRTYHELVSGAAAGMLEATFENEHLSEPR